MNQFLQWLSMGGYALYVWSAYGLVVFVLVLNIWGIKWQQKKTHKQLKRWYKHSESHKIPLKPQEPSS